MSFVLPRDVAAFSLSPDPIDIAALLKQAIEYAQHDRHTEALICFSLARANLPDGNSPFVAALDELSRSYSAFWEAQKVLLAASAAFAQTSTRRMQQIGQIEDLLAGSPPLPGHPPQSQPVPTPASPPSTTFDGLTITCFGTFGVKRTHAPIALGTNRKGQEILRYLVMQPQHSETVDVLMSVMWPEDPPDAARHKMHIAISAVRNALEKNDPHPPEGGYIQCKNEMYRLNPAVPVTVDVLRFEALYNAGRKAGGPAQIAPFEEACRLYTGPFLSEDRYAAWSLIRREQLNRLYVTMCRTLSVLYGESQLYEKVITWSEAVLSVDVCDETAYCQLMAAYATQGQRSEAIQQYQRCTRALQTELGVQPLPDTTDLFTAIVGGTFTEDMLRR